jgi:hypothetical protein
VGDPSASVVMIERVSMTLPLCGSTQLYHKPAKTIASPMVQVM